MSKFCRRLLTIKKFVQSWSGIVLKALAKNVEDRYQNAVDLHDDLQAFLYGEGGSIYSRKDLAAWMKKMFSSEIEDEMVKLEEYRQFTLGDLDKMETSQVSNLGGSSSDDLSEWDEDQETEIYDRDDPDEISADSLVLQEEASKEEASKEEASKEEASKEESFKGGMSQAGAKPASEVGFPHAEKTVASDPPMDLLTGAGAAKDSADLPSADIDLGFMAPSGSAGSGSLSASASFSQGSAREPSRVSQTQSGKRASAGPLPTRPHPSSGSMVVPGRTTATHVPVAPAVKPARTSTWMIPVILMLLALLGGGGYWAYHQLGKPAELQITMDPPDATLLVDGQVVGQGSPVRVSRPSGKYILTVRRKGYADLIQPVEVAGGQVIPLTLNLQPAADTGFELFSDPPGKLVWLDGDPLMGTGPDGQPRQHRTNFRAHKIRPGSHVLEIRGDDDYKPWRHEFDLKPGTMPKIFAPLTPAKDVTSARAPVANRASEPAKKQQVDESESDADDKRVGGQKKVPARPRRRAPARRSGGNAADEKEKNGRGRIHHAHRRTIRRLTSCRLAGLVTGSALGLRRIVKRQ